MPRTPRTAAVVETVPFDLDAELASFKERDNQRFDVDDVVQWRSDSAPRGQERTFWIVRSVTTKTNGDVQVLIDPVAGGRGYKTVPFSLQPVSAEVAAAVQTKVRSTPAVKPVPGMTFKTGGTPDVLVVLAVGTGVVKAAKLEGDGGRFYPKIPIAAIRPCDRNGKES